MCFWVCFFKIPCCKDGLRSLPGHEAEQAYTGSYHTTVLICSTMHEIQGTLSTLSSNINVSISPLQFIFINTLFFPVCVDIHVTLLLLKRKHFYSPPITLMGGMPSYGAIHQLQFNKNIKNVPRVPYRTWKWRFFKCFKQAEHLANENHVTSVPSVVFSPTKSVFLYSFIPGGNATKFNADVGFVNHTTR